MLKINLLPRGERRRPAAGSEAASMLLVGVAGTLVLLIGGLFLFHATQQSQLDELRGRNQQVQGQIDAIKARVADHQKVLDELAEIRRREEAISQLQAARTGPTNMLVELSRILSPSGHPTADPLEIERLRQCCRDQLWNQNWDPHRLWINSMEEDNRNVKISGEGRTPDDVGELMRRLQLSLYFQNVQLARTAGATTGESKLAVQQFTISARVRY